MDQLRLSELANVPLVVLDARAAVAENADYALPAGAVWDDIDEHGPIPAGALVCLRTGWAAARYSSQERYWNATDKEKIELSYGLPQMHFPGFSVEAAEVIVRSGAAGIGVDTLSPDPGASGGFGVHHKVPFRRGCKHHGHRERKLAQVFSISSVAFSPTPMANMVSGTWSRPVRGMF